MLALTNLVSVDGLPILVVGHGADAVGRLCSSGSTLKPCLSSFTPSAAPVVFGPSLSVQLKTSAGMRPTSWRAPTQPWRTKRATWRICGCTCCPLNPKCWAWPRASTWPARGVPHGSHRMGAMYRCRNKTQPSGTMHASSELNGCCCMPEVWARLGVSSSKWRSNQPTWHAGTAATPTGRPWRCRTKFLPASRPAWMLP
jgi:hypothetical protein